MMLHGSQSPSPRRHQSPTAAAAPASTTTTATRKRKAETQENERLSKRLSLLNIEQNGSKLYVPVEVPVPSTQHSPPSMTSNADASTTAPLPIAAAGGGDDDDADDIMKLDDTKHKVYIYNIDDELSASSDDDAASDDGRLVFLPDIHKHLRANRIPPQVLANADGELAGMQLVLYSDPKSLSVPEEQDGVRRAIKEARQRLRDRRAGGVDSDDADDSALPVPSSSSRLPDTAIGLNSNSMWHAVGQGPDSPDAMDMD